MTWPCVVVDQANLLQGASTGIENKVLFVGHASNNIGKLVSLNTQTDFDEVFGEEDHELKADVMAAMNNASSDWSAWAAILDPAITDSDAWTDAVLAAQKVASCEGIALCGVTDDVSVINSAGELRTMLINKYSRWCWFGLSIHGPDEDEAWADYVTRMVTLQDGLAEYAVQLVPRLWGNDLGVLAGRLCNSVVTVADSPARVATGPLVGIAQSPLPVDGTGEEIGLDTLQALNEARFSVPMWYSDYDGCYWADGVTLDVENGNYGVIENVRVTDKVSRNIRLKAIPKIRNRSMNSTPGSTAANQTYFAGVMRDMAKSVTINGVQFPGEVQPPQDGDVTIRWTDADHVEIYVIVRPYNSPAVIEITVALDTDITETEAA